MFRALALRGYQILQLDESSFYGSFWGSLPLSGLMELLERHQGSSPGAYVKHMCYDISNRHHFLQRFFSSSFYLTYKYPLL